MIALVHHPEDQTRLGDILQKNLSDSKWLRFRAAVAFAKLSGTKHLCPYLQQFLRTGAVNLSVGIDHLGTSLEALNELLASLGSNGEIYVFHNEAQSTFHPKVYFFANDEAAECLIGSGNLTEGGLFTNCELFAHLQLDPDNPADAQIITGIEAILDSWSDPALATVRELTTEMLKQLHESGLVPTEAQIRETEAKTQATTVAKSRTERAPKIFGAVKFKPAPKVPTKIRRGRDTGVAAPRPVPPPKTRGFVMTLQRTDVGVGQVTAGTSKRSPEIFIPLAARDANPEFWGWQSRFTQDSAKPGKWDRTGVKLLRTKRISLISTRCFVLSRGVAKRLDDVVDFHRFAPLSTRDHSLHIRVRAFAVFGDETVDPRGDNRQRNRAKLEHRIATHAS
jgi:HKD family nuclease